MEVQLDQKLLDQAAQRRRERASNAARARKTVGNQYTTGKREGHSTQEKDRIRAELAAQRLERHVNGYVKMTAAQVASAKALMDKGKASLQAVEQTVIEAATSRSEADILADFRALFAAYPALVDQLLAERARDVTPKEPLLPADSPQDTQTPDSTSVSTD